MMQSAISDDTRYIAHTIVKGVKPKDNIKTAEKHELNET